MGYDVFISHATEDKDEFVRPLVLELQQKGVSVWYDEFSLKLGDSLTKSINLGLAESKYGIVIISPYFISKDWPQMELGALFARKELDNNNILPVWHNITVDEIKQSYPLLADIVAVQSSDGMAVVVRRILETVNPDLIREKANAIGRLAELSGSIEYYVEANLENAKNEISTVREIATQAQKSIAILTRALKDIDRTGDVSEISMSLVKAEKLISDKLMYCVKCRAKTKKVANLQRLIGKNDRTFFMGYCVNCDTKLVKLGPKLQE